LGLIKLFEVIKINILKPKILFVFRFLKKALLNPDDEYYARYKKHLRDNDITVKLESHEIKTIAGFENKGFENVVEELSVPIRNVVKTDRRIVF